LDGIVKIDRFRKKTRTSEPRELLAGTTIGFRGLLSRPFARREKKKKMFVGA
jgi:hypothetical protein